MRTRKKYRLAKWLAVTAAFVILFFALAFWVEPNLWGYARPVSDWEAALRDRVVETAVAWHGHKESDGTHKPIIDVYNSHSPLARGYAVQYDDEWCSTFASAIAVQCSLTDIIPTECGCERHIELFMAMDAWMEEDDYLPLPGDYIFYHWDCPSAEDCTHWSDHVGIVVGTWNNWIKVVEGNKEDAVGYRWLRVGDRHIRGYGIPDYQSIA